MYQAQVNEMMTRYKQEYNDWYEALSEDEKKVIFILVWLPNRWIKTGFNPYWKIIFHIVLYPIFYEYKKKS